MSPVRLSGDGKKVTHTELTLRDRFVLISPLTHGWGKDHSVELKLYRPGYNLVTVKPWQKNLRIKWKVAHTIPEQEMSVDKLLSLHEHKAGGLYYPPLEAKPDTSIPAPVPSIPWVERDEGIFLFGKYISKHEKRILRFAAKEYSRLAELALSNPTNSFDQVGWIIAPYGINELHRENPSDTAARLRSKVDWLQDQLK